jgi:CBS-domain-containing membrane protein
MRMLGQAEKVCVYIGESDRWGNKPLHTAILELLKAEDCAGATVTRALAGFGAHSRIHTASIVALSADLPLVVEWVDNPDRVQRVMPKLHEMVPQGLITIQDVQVAFYSHRNLRELPTSLRVQDIMSRDVQFVHADAQLEQAGEWLLDKVRRALPVVDSDGRVIGILTETDLLRRLDPFGTVAGADPATSSHLSRADRLRCPDQPVEEVMNADVFTVAQSATVPQVLDMMLDQALKRLPVVDADGKLVGMVSRVDVLRTMSPPLVAERQRKDLPPGDLSRVQQVKTPDPPTVGPDASLVEIVSFLVSHSQRRVVVVDGKQRPIGIITDGDVLERAMPPPPEGAVQSLGRRLSRKTGKSTQLVHRTASEVMTSPVITVTAETSLWDALRLLLEKDVKRLPVVDAEGRVVGLLGRGGALQALRRGVRPDPDDTGSGLVT